MCVLDCPVQSWTVSVWSKLRMISQVIQNDWHSYSQRSEMIETRCFACLPLTFCIDEVSPAGFSALQTVWSVQHLMQVGSVLCDFLCLFFSFSFYCILRLWWINVTNISENNFALCRGYRCLSLGSFSRKKMGQTSVHVSNGTVGSFRQNFENVGVQTCHPRALEPFENYKQDTFDKFGGNLTLKGPTCTPMPVVLVSR